jgi:SSS family solute:Na+ symporter
LTIGNCVSWDFYKKYLNKNATDKSVQVVNKITMIVATIITVLLSINPPKLLAFLIWAGIGIMFSCFAIPLLGGLYWRRATKAGAIASISVGFITSIVFATYDKFINPIPFHFSLLSFLCAALVYIFVSIFTKAASQELLDATETGFFIRKNNGSSILGQENRDNRQKVTADITT